MDNKDLRGQQDRNTINTSENYELKHIEEKFGIKREQLLQAIHEVGNNREKVEEYLRNQQKK
ncbi:MAG TPA: DUF3606 domain-containing protein [Flavitalea sp.]|nr:DUF3606 domain-containing protein [Flavitalea sp.]